MTATASDVALGIAFRPILTDDLERLRRMFYRLSPETIYNRFFTFYSHPPEWALRRLTFVDYVRRYAVVATVGDEVVGVARYDKVAGGDEAEVAVLVEDAWQNRGIGRTLLGWLAAVARTRGVASFTATILADNQPALRMMRALFPAVETQLEGGEYSVRAVV